MHRRKNRLRMRHSRARLHDRNTVKHVFFHKHRNFMNFSSKTKSRNKILVKIQFAHQGLINTSKTLGNMKIKCSEISTFQLSSSSVCLKMVAKWLKKRQLKKPDNKNEQNEMKTINKHQKIKKLLNYCDLRTVIFQNCEQIYSILQ